MMFRRVANPKYIPDYDGIEDNPMYVWVADPHYHMRSPLEKLLCDFKWINKPIMDDGYYDYITSQDSDLSNIYLDRNKITDPILNNLRYTAGNTNKRLEYVHNIMSEYYPLMQHELRDLMNKIIKRYDTEEIYTITGVNPVSGWVFLSNGESKNSYDLLIYYRYENGDMIGHKK